MILDVAGVGYVVHASRITLTKAGQTGDAASLLIETVVREDAISLYGFIDAAEKNWFKMLTGVQGVGAKAALAILSVCPPERLSMVIASQDKSMLTRAEGVGPKLATRIITELKDKTETIAFDRQKPVVSGAGPHIMETGQDRSNDAVSALVNLGYGRSEAYSAVARAKQKVANEDEENLETLIRHALKELAT
jgi:Holliday junction DNA helicase RuvA